MEYVNMLSSEDKIFWPKPVGNQNIFWPKTDRASRNTLTKIDKTNIGWLSMTLQEAVSHGHPYCRYHIAAAENIVKVNL